MILQTNLPVGSLIKVGCENAARVITLRHGNGGAGEMLMVDSADFVLDALDKWVEFQRRSTSWVEVDRSYGVAAMLHDGVRQVVIATSTTDDSISTTSATDTSLTGQITPRFADSKIIVMCFGRVNVQHDTAGATIATRTAVWTLRRSSGTPADLANVSTGRQQSAGASTAGNPTRDALALTGSETPGAGTHTYVLRAQVNSTAIDALLEGSTGTAATMILMEVAP